MARSQGLLKKLPRDLLQSHAGVTAKGDLYFAEVISATENLGSRAAMISSLGKRMRRHRAACMKPWMTNRAAIARKRRAILQSLPYDPAPVPFSPRLLDEKKFAGYTRQHLQLHISPDDVTEGFLYLPDTATARQPVPALLGLHEHGGQFLLGHEKLGHLPEGSVFGKYQELVYGGQPPAEFYASQGFVVLVIDQMGFGSRSLWKSVDEYARRHTLEPEDELALRLRHRFEQSYLHRALMTFGVSECDVALHDNRRSLDFLQTLPQVDGDRIGAFGLSVGCWWTHQLAALDPRVKASVRVCWSGQIEPMLEQSGPRVLGSHFQLPGWMSELHVPEWFALSHPGAALFINGARDTMYTLGNQRRTRGEILRIAQAQGRSERVRWSFFDGPHCFHPPQQREALEFFRKFLGTRHASPEPER